MSRRACAAMSAAPRSGEFLVFIKPKTYVSFGPDPKRLFLINFIKSDLRDQASPVAKGFTSPKSLDRGLEFLFYLWCHDSRWVFSSLIVKNTLQADVFGVNPTS